MVKRSMREMTEFVERDFNHPCIVTWVPVNESWGVRNIQTEPHQQHYAQMMFHLLKAIDGTRLVSANDGWEQIEDTDICAVHDYSLLPHTMEKYDDMENILNGIPENRILFAEGHKYQGQAIVMTEYGGIAFDDRDEAGRRLYCRTNPCGSVRCPAGKYLCNDGCVPKSGKIS